MQRYTPLSIKIDYNATEYYVLPFNLHKLMAAFQASMVIEKIMDMLIFRTPIF